MDNNNCFVVRDKIGQALALRKRAAANAAADDKLSVIRYPDGSMRSEISTESLWIRSAQGRTKNAPFLADQCFIRIAVNIRRYRLVRRNSELRSAAVCRGIAEMASDPGEEAGQI